ADSDPCMYGSATLATVVSSACMMVAVIAQTVSRLRRAPADIPPARRIISVGRLFSVGQPAEPGFALAGVDLDVSAHSGAQASQRRVGVELDPQRHALHHLDPVAAGVLRRQDPGTGGGGPEARIERART